MDFKVLTFYNDDPLDMASPEYAKAFRMWHSVWHEEYKLLGKAGPLFSDSFSRQDQVVAFFIDGECAGLCCYRRADLSTPVGREDSWFHEWPQDVLDQICAMEPAILVCSAFCIAKPFRGQKILNVPIKPLLAASAIEHLVHHTDYRLMLGSMRNNRGTNKPVLEQGAECLRTVEINHEPTDLVVFDRQKLPPLPAEIQFVFRRAWVNRRTQSGSEKKAA